MDACGSRQPAPFVTGAPSVSAGGGDGDGGGGGDGSGGNGDGGGASGGNGGGGNGDGGKGGGGSGDSGGDTWHCCTVHAEALQVPSVQHHALHPGLVAPFA